MIKKIKTNFFDVRYLPEKKFLISQKINIEDLNLNEINSILNRKQIKLKKIKKLSNKTIEYVVRIKIPEIPRRYKLLLDFLIR